MNLNIRRHALTFQPDSARVLLRPFIPVNPQRITTVIGRALTLGEEEAERELQAIMDEFRSRHFDIEALLLRIFEKVRQHLFISRELQSIHRAAPGSKWRRRRFHAIYYESARNG